MKKVTWAFVFHSVGSDPKSNRVVVDGDGISAVLVPVHDEAAALAVLPGLVDEGVQFIELCGAFGRVPGFVSQAEAVTHNKVAIGAVTFTPDSLKRIASVFQHASN